MKIEAIADSLTDLDRHFARLMSQLSGNDNPEVWLAAALVSNATQSGHVCLDLPRIAGSPLASMIPGVDKAVLAPSLAHWLQSLRVCGVVGRPGDFRPLVLDPSNRLYLYRYWRYEQELAVSLRKRLRQDADNSDPGLLADGLRRLFPSTHDPQPDWQKVAGLVAVLRNLTIITGGPGTGKTSTVVKILALLLEQAGSKSCRIAAAAPTGKAAARLKEALRQAKERLNCRREIRERIPDDAATLHRLLGAIPNSSRFRHHRGNPLPYDVVVIDESSMVDVPLMAKLLESLQPDTRLILLGDRDQLASVEPGAVFGDICSGRRENSFSPGFCARVSALLGEELRGLQADPDARLERDAIVILEKSYRFGSKSGIKAASQMVNQGEAEKFLGLLADGQSTDLAYKELTSPGSLESLLESGALDEWASFLREANLERAFSALLRFRVLCALREGPYGAERVNQLLENRLTHLGLIRRRGRWYSGQPVLITRNDYPLRLFNGDVGIICPEDGIGANQTQNLCAFFPVEGGGFRKIALTRLPDHGTVFAMTVHKSQGSEFERVVLILPAYPSEVLTRELLYTGMTRARQHFELWGSPEVLKWAVARRIERSSGLSKALWED